MKKLLALVLALVMTMSLVTISSADFKDADKIDYNEAVDVMNAVGVFIGDDNGNFNPKANLERAQAAKIVAYLLLGNKTAEGLAGSGKFTDVAATNWAAGFIDYCAATGVVAGVGNGKFDPNGSLTTLQFAKMLLVALGYDAKIEGFTGNDWSINVSAKANQVGLLDGLDVGANAALTREQAAKMALNTLKSPLVEYDTKGTTVTVGGDASVTVGASKAEFKTSTNKKAQTISNDVINGTTAYTVEFAEEYYSDLRLTKTTEDFGRDANQWKYKTVEIGTYADDSDLKETYTAKAKRGDLYNLVGSTVVDGIKNGKYNFELYVDGKKVANPNPDNYFVKNSSSATGTTYADGLSGNGVLTEVYMDNDNNVKIVVVYTYLVQATADYNSIKGILSIEYKDVNAADNNDPTLPVTIENDDVNVEGFKADDYILVTYSRSAREIKSAVKAEIVTGEVSEYTEDDYVIVGGTKYSYSKVVGNGADESKTQYTIKEKATVVLDQYGYIICVDDALASSSYVFIKETAKSNGVGNRVAADAYFTDGTNETIIIKKADGKTDANTKLLADGRSAANTSDGQGKWYTFSKDSNGEYTLNALKSTVTRAVGTVTYTVVNPAVGKDVIKNDKIKFMPNAAGTYGSPSVNVADVKGNSSTVFVVLEADGTVTTATGIKNAPNVTTGTTAKSPNATIVASVKNNGAYAEYVFVDLTKDSDATVDGSENAADYMLLLKYTGNKTTDSENNTYYKYKVLFDGQETEKYIDSNITGSDANGLLLRNIKENSKGFVTGGATFDNSTKRVNIALGTAPNNTVSIDKETISIGGQDFYAEKANVTLLINKGANNDLIDQGKDYQLYQTSAKAAAALLKGYTLSGASKAYVLRDDDNSDIAKSIYIFVDSATSPAGGSGSGSGEDQISKNGDATVEYSIRRNGAMKLAVTYTAPEFVAMVDEVEVNILSDGVYVDTVTFSTTSSPVTLRQDAKNALRYTGTGATAAGLFTEGENITFELGDESFSDIYVKYVGADGKTPVTMTSDTNMTMSTTAQSSFAASASNKEYSGNANFALVSGAKLGTGTTLTTGVAVDTSANTILVHATSSDACITANGDAYVVIKVTGLGAPTYTISNASTSGQASVLNTLNKYGVTPATPYSGTGANLKVTVTANKVANIAKDEPVAIEVKGAAGSTVAVNAKPIKVVLDIAGTEFVLVWKNDNTNPAAAVKHNVKITGNADVTVKSVTELSTPTVRTMEVKQGLSADCLSTNAPGDADLIVVTFSEKQTSAPTLTVYDADGTTTSTTLTVGTTAKVDTDGYVWSYAVSRNATDKDTTYVLTYAANAIAGANGTNEAKVEWTVKGLTFALKA